MKPMVIKGVPSLINELASYYKDEGKAKVIGEILEGFQAQMTKEMTLSQDDEEE